MDKIKNKLNSSWKVYEKRVFLLADQMFVEKVVPFCKKRNWQFLAGNGSWWIGPLEGKHIYPEDKPNDTEFQAVAIVLGMEVPGMPYNDLGSLMSDYPNN